MSDQTAYFIGYVLLGNMAVAVLACSGWMLYLMLTGR
jgi:hypothetical protein